MNSSHKIFVDREILVDKNLKIILIDRELNTDQNHIYIYIYIYILFLLLKLGIKNYPKKRNIMYKTAKNLIQKIFS